MIRGQSKTIPLFYCRNNEKVCPTTGTGSQRRGRLFRVTPARVLFGQILILSAMQIVFTNFQWHRYFAFYDTTSSPSIRRMLLENDAKLIYVLPNIDHNKNRHEANRSNTNSYDEFVDYAIDYDYIYGTLFDAESPKSIVETTDKSGLDPWMLSIDHTRHDGREHVYKQRNEQRQQRCRPASLTQKELRQYSSASLYQRRDVTNHESKPIEVDVDDLLKLSADSISTGSSDSNNGWIQDLCAKAQLTKFSRVVITNPFTSQLLTNNSSSYGTATLFTLFIAKQCSVRNIVIVDAMLPNTKTSRLQSMTVYRSLYRNITSLQLLVPIATTGLARKDDIDLNLKWLKTFSPTHLIHFEDTNHRDTVVWDEHLSTKGQQLYHIQNSMLSLQQLLHHCHHRAKHGSSNEIYKKSTKGGDSLMFLQVVISDTFEEKIGNFTTLPKGKHVLPIHDMLHDYYHDGIYQDKKNNNNKGNVHFHQLQIPSYDVPHELDLANLSSDQHDLSFSTDNRDAIPLIAGILKALQPDRTQRRRRMKISHGFSSAAIPFRTRDEFYGIYKTGFPCASSCYNLPDQGQKSHDACEPSIFDSISLVSRAVTSNCTYVVYTVLTNPEDQNSPNIQLEMEDVETIAQDSSNSVCRVVYLSDQSRMVQEKLTEINKKKPISIVDVERYNGKLKSKNGEWTFIWFQQSALSNSDISLFRIEPSHLFSSNVQKAMYVEQTDGAFTNSIYGESLLHLFTNIDRTDQFDSSTIEFRSGNPEISRIIEQPLSNPRTVVFHAHEMEDAPKSVNEYIERSGQSVTAYRQLNYYKQMNQWMQSNDNRPNIDMGGGLFSAPFPWQWTSMQSYVHDLQSEAGRQLRCEWYDAHLYWGQDNLIRNTEDLSLAYVIGKQRLQGYLGPNLEDDDSWIPLLNSDNQEQVINESGDGTKSSELFLRMLRSMTSEVSEQQ
jgi:hypothetical protein